jgi:hypothetical protein
MTPITANPPSGQMIYWRYRRHDPGAWRFGYVSYTGTPDIIRLGAWNGDTMGGALVSPSEIEWKELMS